jgi:hypothetical protein
MLSGTLSVSGGGIGTASLISNQMLKKNETYALLQAYAYHLIQVIIDLV